MPSTTWQFTDGTNTMDEALARHLDVLTRSKRALLQLGEGLLTTDPGAAHLILQICRALSASTRDLVANAAAEERQPKSGSGRKQKR